MEEYDYYYYVIYEYEFNGGITKANCEYRWMKEITHFYEIEEMATRIQRSKNCTRTPLITFYSLLRKEKRAV